MAYGQSTNYVDFSGGVNPNAGVYLLAENQAKDARNYRPSPVGGLRKREGFESFSTPTSLLDSIHTLFPCNTSTKSLIAVGKQAGASNDRIIKIDTGGTGSTLESTLTQGKRWSFCQAPINTLGPIFGVNGTSTPQSWDGAAASMTDWTATTGTVPSSARFLIYHADRIWATGSETDSLSGRVWYSGLTASAVPGPDPRNWDTDNYVDIEPQDGEFITGIGEVGPYIVAFKPRNTYVITDPVTGAWRQISNETGCIAHRTIQQTPAGTFFLSEDVGVCVTNGQGIDADIGAAVWPFIEEAAKTNPASLHNACGAYFDDAYWLSIPYGASGANDLLLEYDLRGGGWWPHSQASNDFALQDPVGTPKLYSIDPSAARVHRVLAPGIYADNGSAYTGGTYIKTAYFPWGEPHLNKRVNQFRVDGKGAWTFGVATSFSDSYSDLEGVVLEEEGTASAGGTFGGSGTYGGSGTFGVVSTSIVTQRAYFTPGFGRAWSMEITNDDSSYHEIFSLAAFLRPRTD
jgi:hypothetical protein